MTTETFNAEQTWQLLWSRAAQQVMSYIPPMCGYGCVSIGYGWGLRSHSDPRRTLLLHPSSNSRGIGDLALTVTGAGTRVIPRDNAGFVEYMQMVADIVEDALNRAS